MTAPTDPPIITDSTEGSSQPGGIRWNVLVGVLGVLYACAGMLMHAVMVASSFLFEQLMAMAGMTGLEMPGVLRWVGGLQSCVILIAGLLLGIGSVLLIMRRPAGATLMKVWVGIRLLMLVVGLGAGIALMNANLEFQASVAEAQVRLLKERNVPESQWPTLDRESQERQARVLLAAFTIIPAAFPLFVGLLLTNRRKKADIESWKMLMR